MSKSLYSELEQNARVFLNNSQQKGGPPIYTMSPDNARAVLSGLQASYPVAKIPSDIENRTIPDSQMAKTYLSPYFDLQIAAMKLYLL